MNLQIIKSTRGTPEYVLVPYSAYQKAKPYIEKAIANDDDAYVPFVLEDYVTNPVAMARIKAGYTQKELAQKMQVTQAYICKLEKQASVSPKTLEKLKRALKRKLK